MAGGELRKWLGAGVAASMLAIAMPAAAQNYTDGYKLLQSVEKEDRAEFDRLIAKNHTVVNARDKTNGRTGLHIAVDRRDNTWLSYLISNGANANIADTHGVTPLMLASRLGWVEGMQTLLRAGARVDDPSDTGETPLIFAVHQRNTQMMRVLLAAGADPDRPDNSGRSARDYAKLDGGGSIALAEIERSGRPAQARQSAGEVYGPR